MPIRERTSHEIPEKKATESGLFKKHGGSGASLPSEGGTGGTPHKAGLNYAVGNANKQRGVGGRKTLTR